MDDLNLEQALFAIGVVVIAAGFMFLPTVIAYRRDVAVRRYVLLVNLLVGWTGLGWLVCMLWAGLGPTRAQEAIGRAGAVDVECEQALQAVRAGYAVLRKHGRVV